MISLMKPRVAYIAGYALTLLLVSDVPALCKTAVPSKSLKKSPKTELQQQAESISDWAMISPVAPVKKQAPVEKGESGWPHANSASQPEFGGSGGNINSRGRNAFSAAGGG